MSSGYSVSIGSETKAFRQGIESGVITPLEDATGTLKDLGESKSLEELERDLGDAQKATKELGDEIKTTGREISSKSRQAFRDMKEAAQDGTGDAGEAVKGFKDEATQNFSQLASSFDGSVSSIADAAQGTLGGLASSISGPVGIGLGAIGAAAGFMFADIIGKAEAMKESVSEMFGQMVDNGKAALDVVQEQQRMFDIIDEQGDWLAEASEKTGIPVQRLITALARGGDEARRLADVVWEMRSETLDFPITKQLTDKLNAAADATDKAKELYDTYVRTTTAGAHQQGDRLAALAERLGELNKEITTTIKLDTSDLDRELARPRQVNVRLGIDRSGRAVI